MAAACVNPVKVKWCHPCPGQLCVTDGPKIADLATELEPRLFNPLSSPAQVGSAATEVGAQSKQESKG